MVQNLAYLFRRFRARFYELIAFIGLLLVLAEVFGGCNFLPPQYQKYWTALVGGEVKTQPVPSHLPQQEEYFSQSAKSSKVNSELLYEMIKVVSIREQVDRSEFGSLVDSMNQGASLEGIYNGFTHSSNYRQLEASKSSASALALKIFGEELALLESELPAPTEFDAASAQPLQYLSAPTGDSGSSEVSFGGDASAGSPGAGAVNSVAQPASPVNIPALAAKYSKLFVGASIYTLKRVLGDEALKVIASKNQYHEKLSLWYSKWVVHMASRNVDFGIALRNKPDEAFHYKWAVSVSADRLQWEVLNRLHRVLNDANKEKQ